MSPNSDHPSSRVTRLIAFVCLLPVLTLGCMPQGEVTSVTQPTVVNLRAVRDSYFEAIKSLKHPARSKEELTPFLQKFGDPAEKLRSPDDGEEYVIVYGIEPMAPDSINHVWAYERHGKNGSRWCIRGRNVQRMTSDSFAKATFPPGHKPSF
jgi:hypothetical protein